MNAAVFLADRPTTELKKILEHTEGYIAAVEDQIAGLNAYVRELKAELDRRVSL